MRATILRTLALAGLIIMIGAPAQAAPITFFGEDLGLGDTGGRLPAHPKADAARASFFSHLVGAGTEDFEALPANVVDFGGGLTATLSGGAKRTLAAGATRFGRYPTSGDSFWDVDGPLSLAFSVPVSAFGFYGVDIGDFGGRVTLTTVSGTPLFFEVPHTIRGEGGGVLYFGFYTTVPGEAFTAISFGDTAAGMDAFGFDDFTAATLDKITVPVAEPASMLLFAAGLAGVAVRARRSRKT